MNLKVEDIVSYLGSIAPPELQESYDNSGLLVGNPKQEVSKLMVCLDITPALIDEARNKGCNMIVSHHPIIFGGLKRLTGRNYVEQSVIKAIKGDIALYACHTNLDNILYRGVNEKIGLRLGLNQIKTLRPKTGMLYKLVTFCPHEHALTVREAMFNAGAGQIGNYDNCSFNQDGQGTFRAGQSANPYVGRIGEMHTESETRIETVVPAFAVRRVTAAMQKAHPYEEVAYDLYPLANEHPGIGSGVVGDLPAPMPPESFLAHLRKSMNVQVIRYTELHRDIKRVALCGGSGSFLLPDAIAAGADVFISSDFKYHQFFDAEDKIMIADIGHYEAEYFTIELLHDILTEKFSTFAVVFSETNTNPIKYYS